MKQKIKSIWEFIRKNFDLLEFVCILSLCFGIALFFIGDYGGSYYYIGGALMWYLIKKCIYAINDYSDTFRNQYKELSALSDENRLLREFLIKQSKMVDNIFNYFEDSVETQTGIYFRIDENHFEFYPYDKDGKLKEKETNKQ